VTLPRTELLARVLAALPESRRGDFCIACGAPGVDREEAGGEENFRCRACGVASPRAFHFDGKARHWLEGGELLHESAGAVVRRDGRTLLFLRRRFPLLWTIPAGHVEEGADPEAEMRREVEEETGLVVARARRLFSGERVVLEDPCRRGADWHLWNVYEAEAEGTPRLSDESRVVGWFDGAEVRDLARRGALIRPVAAIFRGMGLVP
jgi:ADP-ribose pyrophosphatase YjhB (NUDIX family)